MAVQGYKVSSKLEQHQTEKAEVTSPNPTEGNFLTLFSFRNEAINVNFL